MMEIVLLINGDEIDRITVTNRGPYGGAYVDGDGPGGGGERDYEWRCGSRAGHLHHYRRHGIHALAARVLAAMK